MDMRTTGLVFALASVLPACQGSVTNAGGGATTSMTASSSSSSGAGGASSSTCSFTVSGAIDATVVDSSAIAYLGPFVECGGSTAGVVMLGFGPLHGPGAYDSNTIDVSGYQYVSSCSMSGCTDIENYGGTSASSACVVDLKVAPSVEQVGDPIAGTFSCPAFVDDADPTRTVSITGSFSTVMRAPPM